MGEENGGKMGGGITIARMSTIRARANNNVKYVVLLIEPFNFRLLLQVVPSFSSEHNFVF